MLPNLRASPRFIQSVVLKAKQRAGEHSEGKHTQKFVRMAEESNEGAGRSADSKDLMQQNKALDSLTDHVEDRQLNSIRLQEVRNHDLMTFASSFQDFFSLVLVTFNFTTSSTKDGFAQTTMPR
eukprot:Gb_37891 [translate_table: standard]